MSLARPLFIASVVAAFACGSTSGTDIINPITGVTIRAESLTEGRGCGTAAGQVYKYAAVVTAESGGVVASNVYDCFADGNFVNLAASPSYALAIFAYDRTGFEASEGAIVTNASQLNANAVQLLGATRPLATTTCTARQLENVQTLAACKPLQDGVAGVALTPVTPADAADAAVDAP